MNTFNGIVMVIMFCTGGEPVIDGLCHDNSKPVQVQLTMLSSQHCDYTQFSTVKPEQCPLDTLFEVTRDGVTVAKVPAFILSKKENELIFSQMLEMMREHNK